MLIVAGPVGEHEHEGGPHHPERPARIAAAMAGVADLDLGDDLVMVDPVALDMETLARVHDRGYLDELSRTHGQEDGQLDPDTYVSADSWSAACRSAGAGLAAVRTLAERGEGVAFVASRPPGHHATARQGMGFCLLNNIALAAAELTSAGERVAIVDWDVHHGNGTQDIFWDDPSVLYISTHQWPLYPGTGRPHEVGGPHAVGTNLNVPLPARTTGDVLRRAFDELIAPVVVGFAPTWILVSAGFDGHRADPLAEFGLSAGDFADLARSVAGWCHRPGRLALFLEGGYDLRALRGSVEATSKRAPAPRTREWFRS